MNDYKYILEPYKGLNSRYNCPNCQRPNKTFSRYINTDTGEQLHPNVGRCNRESNCGYHYTPKQYFQDNNITDQQLTGSFYPNTRARAKRCGINTIKPISLIPPELFKASLKGHEENNFVQYLINLFGVEITSDIVSRYFIGTSKFWESSTVFWQIDTHGKIRTGKIMLYSPATGKRVKEPYNHINWVHKTLKKPEYELRQCLFGEHLLIDNNKPVAIVESEKTAVIASVYLPQFIWVAVGSLTNLTPDKCNTLKGRTVTLFPDLNGYNKWTNKAKELSHLTTFIVSDLLERKATDSERRQGFDLADYLVKFDSKDFAIANTHIAVQQVIKEKPMDLSETLLNLSNTDKPISENWEQDITELESYFTSISIPTLPIKLNHYSTITDCPLFIESHLATIKANNGKRNFIPYLNRLQELKTLITNELQYEA